MVSLPGFRHTHRRGHNATEREKTQSNDDSDRALSLDSYTPYEIKRATHTRLVWSVIASVCLFITVIFLVVVEIGNTHNVPGLRNIWFIRLNLANIVPTSFGPNASLLNSIARTLGLHDFYQVGLWNFCEGYDDMGVTNCSKPRTLYYFDPVRILLNELLSGATIQLPEQLTSILDIIRIASLYMFALFLTGICLSFVSIFLMPLSIYSRWVAFAMTIVSLLNAICVVAASVIGTVMFIIMRNVFQENTTVNIQAEIGVTMYALMWVASAFAVFAFVIQICLMCCCTSRRDVKQHKGKYKNKA